jgi:pyruvate ferredoxin oxidoreductase delta subunit
VDGVPEIDLNYCKGCGICSFECPSKCIVMVKEGTE